MKVAGQRSTTKVFAFAGALAVLGALLFATSALAAPKEGPTGPTGATGATGPEGKEGKTGPTGPEGRLGAGTCLPSKATETGVWDAWLGGPAGAPQQEADGTVSYQIPLCIVEPFAHETQVEMVYLTEAESEEPLHYVALGCEGSQSEAGAKPGHLCLFTANGPGATEPEWKNAKFAHMNEPDGVESVNSGTQGARAVFRTTGFRATGLGTIPAGGAYLVAGGAWAVTAP